MKIHLSISGGMGLMLNGTVDTADLPEELAEKAEFLLTTERLKSATAAQPMAQAVDMREFDITIAPDKDASDAIVSQRYSFTEADGNIEVVDLLDELMRQIIRRKRNA